MCTRLLPLGLLVGSAALGCGSRTDVAESPGSASADAGIVSDASATDDFASPADAMTTVDAGATGDVGATPGEQCRSPADSGTAADAAALDAGACVCVDISTYDRSCTTAADCTLIHAGTVCSTECACGGNVFVNASGWARYRQTIAPLHLGNCPCPSGPTPQCVQGQCVQVQQPVQPGQPRPGWLHGVW